ncbi:MAG: hypothetical protein V4534_03380 [Myxococcota bacterium]
MKIQHHFLTVVLVALLALPAGAAMDEAKRLVATKVISLTTSLISVAFGIRVATEKLATQPTCSLNLVPACCSVTYGANRTQLAENCVLGNTPFEKCEGDLPVLMCINPIRATCDEPAIRSNMIDAEVSTLLPAGDTLALGLSLFTSVSALLHFFFLNCVDSKALPQAPAPGEPVTA